MSNIVSGILFCKICFQKKFVLQNNKIRLWAPKALIHQNYPPIQAPSDSFSDY
jgi:hypothetical protein